MKEILSRKTKLIYGSGDLGFSLTTTIIGAYFLFFLTDVVGIKPAVAGIAILIGSAPGTISTTRSSATSPTARAPAGDGGGHSFCLARFRSHWPLC